MIRLTDEHWERIRDRFPEEHIPDGRPGRKPVPTRRVLEAVLWILNTGAQWHMLPQSYPNYKTVHRRFQSWCHSEVLRQVLTDVANELRDKGVLDERWHRDGRAAPIQSPQARHARRTPASAICQALVG
jgi:transposase